MDEFKIKCSLCEQLFTLKKNLYAHLRNVHKTEPLSKNQTQLICEVCGTKFSSKWTLSRHVKTFHKLETDHDYSIGTSTRHTRLVCPYDTCKEKLCTYVKLRRHLCDKHNIDTELEEFTFDSITEFEKWKNEMQQQTLAMYTLDTATKTLQNGINKRYYNCHRSYNYKSKGNNIRAIKSVGTNKIDRACPSRLEVEMSEKDGTTSSVTVKFWKTHCGHTEQIGRITLDKEIRAKISEKLKGGVAFDYILNEIHDAELISNGSGRLCLFERKDMPNIVRDFNINYSTKPHQNDSKLPENQHIISKAERILSFSTLVSISATTSKKIETHLDKVIELLNENRAVHLEAVESVNVL